ncbi:MAG: 4Fe-4S dicluster domain-containing protein [Chloroflexi bacterium]|nr:4Fe-4S dicluster domain-containing protein [Chloroflexota bacterium]
MKRVYVNEPACIGCRLCEVHCQFAHSSSKDLVKAFKKAAPPLPRLRVEVKKPVSFSVRCQHCDEPACVYACLTGALTKDEKTGVVSVDTEKCMGCWTCILVCPYAAITRDGDKISKCDLCTGKPLPSCVANCPNEALVYAETRES